MGIRRYDIRTASGIVLIMMSLSSCKFPSEHSEAAKAKQVEDPGPIDPYLAVISSDILRMACAKNDDKMDEVFESQKKDWQFGGPKHALYAGVFADLASPAGQDPRELYRQAKRLELRSELRGVAAVSMLEMAFNAVVADFDDVVRLDAIPAECSGRKPLKIASDTLVTFADQRALLPGVVDKLRDLRKRWNPAYMKQLVLAAYEIRFIEDVMLKDRWRGEPWAKSAFGIPKNAIFPPLYPYIYGASELGFPAQRLRHLRSLFPILSARIEPTGVSTESLGSAIFDALFGSNSATEFEMTLLPALQFAERRVAEYREANPGLGDDKVSPRDAVISEFVTAFHFFADRSLIPISARRVEEALADAKNVDKVRELTSKGIRGWQAGIGPAFAIACDAGDQIEELEGLVHRYFMDAKPFRYDHLEAFCKAGFGQTLAQQGATALEAIATAAIAASVVAPISSIVTVPLSKGTFISAQAIRVLRQAQALSAHRAFGSLSADQDKRTAISMGVDLMLAAGWYGVANRAGSHFRSLPMPFVTWDLMTIFYVPTLTGIARFSDFKARYERGINPGTDPGFIINSVLAGLGMTMAGKELSPLSGLSAIAKLEFARQALWKRAAYTWWWGMTGLSKGIVTWVFIEHAVQNLYVLHDPSTSIDRDRVMFDLGWRGVYLYPERNVVLATKGLLEWTLPNTNKISAFFGPALMVLFSIGVDINANEWYYPALLDYKDGWSYWRAMVSNSFPVLSKKASRPHNLPAQLETSEGILPWKEGPEPGIDKLEGRTPLTPTELAAIEYLANKFIDPNQPILKTMAAIAAAMEMGDE